MINIKAGYFNLQFSELNFRITCYSNSDDFKCDPIYVVDPNIGIVTCKSIPKGCRGTDACEGMYYVEVIGNLTLKWAYRVDNHCDNTNFRVRV